MRFALAGNPNSGKTTLFNSLTGSTAHVGNWPGVTVDKKEGIYRLKREGEIERIKIIDLPGIYSLSPYTPEEVIARQFIMDEKPDLIINIVDSTNLERNLYLTTQLLEMDIPVVVALNMMDIIKKEGSEIDVETLSQKLGVPVVPVSALKSDNVKTLMQTCMEYVKIPRKGFSFLPRTKLGEQYGKALHLVNEHRIKHPVFHAVKLLENDSIELRHNTNLSANIQSVKLEYETQDKPFDYEAEIADLRYKFITDEVKPQVVKVHKNTGAANAEKIDKVLTHRIWGIPIFLLIIFSVFHIIFAEDFLFLKRFGLLQAPVPAVELAAPAAEPANLPSATGAEEEVEGIPGLGILLQGYVEKFQDIVSNSASSLLVDIGAAPWARGVIVDGLINGVCSVLTFLPQILLLFLFLSLLEDSGYMSRIAFIMDRALKRFGLSGKAFLPMLMGFGCSVPAMMGTRTLGNLKEKRLTLILIPFFSCGAKMAIWSIIVAAVFPHNADFVVFTIYAIGIVVAVFGAILLKKTVFRGVKSNFVMELPVYRLPRLKNTLLQLWDKLRGFVVEVTTIVAAATIVIWFLQNFNLQLQMVAQEDSATSILGVIGNSIKWIFVPLGFAQGPDGWKLVVAILTGLIAKEAVIATMGVLYIPGVADVGSGNLLIPALVSLSVFSPESAMSFMVFNLLSIPCFAALATAYSELKSAKWTAFTIVFWFATAWTVSFVIYHAGSLLHRVNPVNIIILAFIAAIIVIAVLRRKNKRTKCFGCDKCLNGKNDKDKC
jgi:ferrous iron transport protein B